RIDFHWHRRSRSPKSQKISRPPHCRSSNSAVPSPASRNAPYRTGNGRRRPQWRQLRGETATNKAWARCGRAHSRHHLHGLYLQLVEMIADCLSDEAGGDWRAVVVQDRYQTHRIDAAFVDDERTQLCVSVLLHDENEIMVGDETIDAGMERESADTHAVERMATSLDHVDCLVHSR